MTSKDVETELERDPFVPLALHLVSGTVVMVPIPSVAWLMQNAMLVFQNPHPGRVRVDGYDIVALRNIERIDPLPETRASGQN